MDFLACQQHYLLSYIYGLEPEKEKEVLRIGSMWHKTHELLELKPGEFCPRCAKREEVSPTCYICDGTGRVPEDQMDCVIRYLNKSYAKTPDNMTADEWELERVKLLYSLTGHRWFYGNTEKRWSVIGSEIKFEIPVYKPGGKRQMPKVVFVCKIDRLVRDNETGLVYVWERKSTGRPMNDQYWSDLTSGDQVMGYLYGGRVAQAMGLLKPYGINPEDDPIAGAWCDVWHKPDISPKMLTQKDTATLRDDGTYCGESFEVLYDPRAVSLVVNGVPAPIIEGKQGIAIRETPEMYGARLLQDVTERPENYFQQRAVTRTDAELEEFAFRLPKIAEQIRFVERKNLWIPCKGSCHATYRCDFLDFCQSGVTYKPGDPAPVGYKLGYGSVPAVPTFNDGTEVKIGE
jgi:hypothetical protein